MKTGVMYGIVPDASSETRVRCAFCGVYLSKSSKCIEQHTNGSRHKDNIELMAMNGITFKNEVLFCKPCNRTLADDESITKHVEVDDHANWMTAMEDLVDEEFIDLEPYLSAEKDDVYCEVCNQTIECTLQNVEKHVNLYNHRANVCEKLKPLNGLFPIEHTGEMWCKICDLYFENTVTSILEHIDDNQQHIDWMDEMEELIEEHDISIKDYLANKDEVNAYCNKCQGQVTCNSQSIEDHINSEAHLIHFDN